MKRLKHELPPIFSRQSRILILGSFPSVKSREISFYYGHKMNRFWKVLSILLNEKLPENNSERKALVLNHKIALWDVVQSCEINGSSDSSIRNVKANEISRITSFANIALIVCNGSKAYDLFNKFINDAGPKVIKLPSTSPANAAWSLDKLVEAYRVILEYVD